MGRMGEAAARRARVGVAFLLSAVPAGYGAAMLLASTSQAAEQFGAAGAAVVRGVALVGAVFVAFALVFGVVQLTRAAAGVGRRALVGTVVAGAGLLAMAVGVAGSMLAWLQTSPFAAAVGMAGQLGLVVMFIGMVLAGVGWGSMLGRAADREAPPSRATTSRARAVAGITAFCAILAVIAFGLVDALVWGPLAQAPSFTLDGLYAALAPADVSYGVGSVIVWAVIWTLAASALLLVCLAPSKPGGVLNLAFTPRRTLILALVIASFATFWQGWATFSLGMSIADTLPPYVGGHGPFWGVYTAFGQACFVVALLMAIVPARRGRGAESSSPPIPGASATEFAPPVG